MFGTLAAFFTSALQLQLTYRVANWAGLFTNVFFLLFRAYAIGAMYTSRADIEGLDAAAAVAYVAITQAILMVVPQWGVVGVAQQVTSGQIAVELLRPVDYVAAYQARRLGISTYYVGMRMLPLLAVSAGFGLLTAPTVAGAAMFAVSLLLGAWIANLLLLLVELSSFWLESERGVRLLVLGGAVLPSGLILPLAYFPDPLEALFRLTPFPYTMNLPAELWLGLASGPDALLALGVQLAWAVGLWGAARFVFALGTRRLLVVGG